MTPAHNHTLVCLHHLGGSARTWSQLEPLLPSSFRLLALDLPGFGDNTAPQDHSVRGMATAIARTIATEVTGPWSLIGHSMGAKIATVLARQSEDGHLPNLETLILLAGSPPCPEPIPSPTRALMQTWFPQANPETARRHAQTFIDRNVAAPLPPEANEQAIQDLLRMNPAAWQAWLEAGSREDWAARIGILHTPALILAGEHDDNLGLHAQQTLTAPHFANHVIAPLPGAAHLLPRERPEHLGHLITAHIV